MKWSMLLRRTLASRLLRVLAVATCAASGSSIVGCGGDVSGAGGSTSASGAGGHGPCWPDSCTGPSSTAAGSGGACNTLGAQGGVNAIDETSTPPNMTGGPLVDGTYVMTALKIFHDADAGPFGGGPPRQEVYQIVGTSLETVSVINLGGPEGAEGHASFGSLVAAVNHISAKVVCGGGGDLDVTYTSDGIHLQILWPQDPYGNTWLREFDRQ